MAARVVFVAAAVGIAAAGIAGKTARVFAMTAGVVRVAAAVGIPAAGVIGIAARIAALAARVIRIATAVVTQAARVVHIAARVDAVTTGIIRIAASIRVATAGVGWLATWVGTVAARIVRVAAAVRASAAGVGASATRIRITAARICRTGARADAVHREGLNGRCAGGGALEEKASRQFTALRRPVLNLKVGAERDERAVGFEAPELEVRTCLERDGRVRRRMTIRGFAKHHDGHVRGVGGRRGKEWDVGFG